MQIFCDKSQIEKKDTLGERMKTLMLMKCIFLSYNLQSKGDGVCTVSDISPISHSVLEVAVTVVPGRDKSPQSCWNGSDRAMFKVICLFTWGSRARLSGLGVAECSVSKPQVITVICGPCRRQIRLRSSMICSWKSTPLKSKSILLEKLPKDKVLWAS